MAAKKKSSTAAEVASALEEVREDLANDVRSEQREECKEVRNLLQGVGIKAALGEVAKPQGPPQLALALEIDQFPAVRRLIAKLIMDNDDVMVEDTVTVTPEEDD